MDCTFTNYASGYIYKASLSNPCPLGCDETGTYQYMIPIKNRGDNFYTGGTFMVIERYTDIDVGMGTINNAIDFVPGTINDFWVGNDGSNTIEDYARLYVTYKPWNIMPTLANKGRSRIVLPS